MFSCESPSVLLTADVNDLRTRMGRSPKIMPNYLGLPSTFLLEILEKTVMVTKQTLVCIDLD